MEKSYYESLLADFKENSINTLTNYQKLLTKASTEEEKAWARFWLNKAQQSISNVNDRMKALSENIMQVYDSTVEARPFWLDIMDTVTKSIRTTNILSQASIGRILNTTLLMKQKETIERGVRIERVFIYNPKDHDQIADLTATLSTQLLCRIDVYVLEDNIFRSEGVMRGYKLGNAEDFMIIDDIYIYETIYDMDSASYRNRLINDPQNLVIKGKVWEEMMKRAIKITFKNVNTFNNDI
jgi:predicted transcriptional regulator